MLNTRTEVKDGVEIRTEVKDGVKWTYKNTLGWKDASQPGRVIFSLATYKCDRCGHVWSATEQGIPSTERRCIMSYCGNPSLPVILFRQLRGEKISGFGKAIEIEVSSTGASR